MPKRRQRRPRPQPVPNEPNLFTHALYVHVAPIAAFHAKLPVSNYSSRIPPRQLPLLGSYAYLVTWAAKHGWIDVPSAGQAGSAVVGVLSMGK